MTNTDVVSEGEEKQQQGQQQKERLVSFGGSSCSKEDVEEDGELLVKIHEELMNMGQALKCPLCLHTLRGVPVLTSCGHAFCRECLSDCCHHSNQWWCPVCKHGMASKKRGWVSSPHLESLVKAYKLGLRAFGMTPIVYAEGLCMTQINDDSTNNAEDPSLQQCHEHLEVSRSIHKALQQRLPKEHLNHQRKKIQTLLHDQQRVIQEDEKALVRAAVAKQKQNTTTNTTTNINDDSTLLLHDGNTLLQNDTNNNDSTIIINDGNTLLLGNKNNNRLNDTDTTLMDESREQEAADQWLESDNQQDHHVTKEQQEEDSSQPIFLSALEQHTKATDFNTTKTTTTIIDPISPSNLSNVVKQSDTSRDESNNKENKEPKHNKKNNNDNMVTPQVKDRFIVGSIVRVQSRTWAGINKPGGVGRITKMTPSSNHPSVCTYNVKYVLGGSEKNVDAVFIQQEPDHNTDKSSTPRRQKRQRSFLSPSPSPRRKKNKQKSTTSPKPKQKIKTPAPSKPTSTSSSIPKTSIFTTLQLPTDKPAIIHPPTTKQQPDIDIYREASRRYNSLLTKDKILYVVTSGLNDYDKNIFNIFVSELKSWKDCNYTVKVTNDLVVDKTVLCVTSANNTQNGVTSRLRTLKIMRAALAAIPIVTPAWISECLKKRTIVIPPPSFSKDDPMFISTIPSKMMIPKEHSSTSFGVWSLAASSHQKQPSLLLDKCHIYLCGAWKKSAKKDILSLLEPMGAQILPNAAATLKVLSSFQYTTETLIFLCHEDSTTDKQCGITQPISKSIQKLSLSKSQFMVVNSNWLYECITSAQKLDSKQYPPNIPKAKLLWQKFQ